MANSKSKKSASPGDLSTSLRSLAEDEYMNRFMVTGDVVSAQDVYRKTLGDLTSKVPERVELRAIELRKQHLAILDPEIRRVKRAEWKEFNLLRSQLLRMLLNDDIAETGIPDSLSFSDLKNLGPDEINTVITAFTKLQDMRRSILSS